MTTVPVPDNKLLAPRILSLVKELHSTCQELLEISKKERASFKSLTLDTLNDDVVRRRSIVEQLASIGQERVQLVKEANLHPATKITELCKMHLSSDQLQSITPLLKEIDSLSKTTRLHTRAFSQEVEFGLRAVSGLLSIFSSATESVATRYDTKGKLLSQTVAVTTKPLPKKQV